MMRREPQPSSTAENSRFSMMAVTAIHQRRANAVDSVGAIVNKREVYERTDVNTSSDL